MEGTPNSGSSPPTSVKTTLSSLLSAKEEPNSEHQFNGSSHSETAKQQPPAPTVLIQEIKPELFIQASQQPQNSELQDQTAVVTVVPTSPRDDITRGCFTPPANCGPTTSSEGGVMEPISVVSESDVSTSITNLTNLGGALSLFSTTPGVAQVDTPDGPVSVLLVPQQQVGFLGNSPVVGPTGLLSPGSDDSQQQQIRFTWNFDNSSEEVMVLNQGVANELNVASSSNGLLSPTQSAESQGNKNSNRPLAGGGKVKTRTKVRPYDIFAKERYHDIKMSSNRSVTIGELSKVVAQEWRNLPKEQFRMYEQKALQMEEAMVGKKRASRGAPSRKSISGFILFSKERRRSVAEQYPDKSFGEVSKLTGEEWRNLPAEERLDFESRAAQISCEKIAALEDLRRQQEEERRQHADALPVVAEANSYNFDTSVVSVCSPPPTQVLPENLLHLITQAHQQKYAISPTGAAVAQPPPLQSAPPPGPARHSEGTAAAGGARKNQQTASAGTDKWKQLSDRERKEYDSRALQLAEEKFEATKRRMEQQGPWSTVEPHPQQQFQLPQQPQHQQGSYISYCSQFMDGPIQPPHHQPPPVQIQLQQQNSVPTDNIGALLSSLGMHQAVPEVQSSGGGLFGQSFQISGQQFQPPSQFATVPVQQQRKERAIEVQMDISRDPPIETVTREELMERVGLFEKNVLEEMRSKQPAGGFILFSKTIRQRLRGEHPTEKFGMISRLTGIEWNKLDKAEKADWERWAHEQADGGQLGSPDGAGPSGTGADLLPPTMTGEARLFVCSWNHYYRCSQQFPSLYHLYEHICVEHLANAGPDPKYCRWTSCSKTSGGPVPRAVSGKKFPNLTRLLRHVRVKHLVRSAKCLTENCKIMKELWNESESRRYTLDYTEFWRKHIDDCVGGFKKQVSSKNASHHNKKSGGQGVGMESVPVTLVSSAVGEEMVTDGTLVPKVMVVSLPQQPVVVQRNVISVEGLVCPENGRTAETVVTVDPPEEFSVENFFRDTKVGAFLGSSDSWQHGDDHGAEVQGTVKGVDGREVAQKRNYRQRIGSGFFLFVKEKRGKFGSAYDCEIVEKIVEKKKMEVLEKNPRQVDEKQ